MVRIDIDTFGSSNKAAGWNSIKIGIDKEKTTIADALKSAQLQNGKTLFDLIANGHELNEDFGIFLSGRLLKHPVSLQMHVQDLDRMVIVDFPFQLGGG